MRAKIKCPYCKFENVRNVDVSDVGYWDEVFYCEADAGGCDKKMYAEYRVQIETVGLKIEGQEEK